MRISYANCDFADIRREGYFYVDKTPFLPRLEETEGKYDNVVINVEAQCRVEALYHRHRAYIRFVQSILRPRFAGALAKACPLVEKNRNRCKLAARGANSQVHWGARGHWQAATTPRRPPRTVRKSRFVWTKYTRRTSSGNASSSWGSSKGYFHSGWLKSMSSVSITPQRYSRSFAFAS
jgi:hypothetical protein